jgi:hypothetical protein
VSVPDGRHDVVLDLLERLAGLEAWRQGGGGERNVDRQVGVGTPSTGVWPRPRRRGICGERGAGSTAGSGTRSAAAARPARGSRGSQTRRRPARQTDLKTRTQKK